MNRNGVKLSRFTTNNIFCNLINFNGGQPRKSVQFAPSKILDPHLISTIQTSHKYTLNPRSFDIIDYNSLIRKTSTDNNTTTSGNNFNKFVKNAIECSLANFKIFQTNSEAMKNNDFVVNIGGDHSIGIGTVLSTLYKHKDCVVVWIDAHADINKVIDSYSGNIHGCPLSFASGLNKPNEIKEFDWTYNLPKLKLDNLIYIGLRDVDQKEQHTIEANSIKAYYMKDVKQLGIEEIITQINYFIKHKQRPVHLSVDVDSIDPLYTPSTGTPVENGLSLSECYSVCKFLGECELLVSLDLVEVHPGIGSQVQADQTISVAKNIIKCALGLPTG